MKIPAILSPGGDPDSVKAAIVAGADAVYLGLDKYNARSRARNITETELKALISIAHSKDVEIYVTMNVLFVQNEISDVLLTASRLYDIGVDGLIVQDTGFAFLLKQKLPDLNIHASTQMTTHNSLQIKMLKNLNISQVNFSRELSFHELDKVCLSACENGMKTEVFVHGAYCVSCSGICYFSSFAEGESANRGACVQLCRRKYSLTRDGKKILLLNLKDNCAIRHAERLVKAGVDVFKIEGRIKNFFYTYVVTDTWRKRLDDMRNGCKTDLTIHEARLGSVFNRSFSTGYLEDNISSEMFAASSFDRSLRYAGKVVSYSADKHVLLFDCREVPVPGSRIAVFTHSGAFICTAEILEKTGPDSVRICIENILMGKILKGHDIFITYGPVDTENVIEKINRLKALPEKITVTVSGAEGKSLKAVFMSSGRSSEVQSNSLLVKAEKNPLNDEVLKSHFGRLGDTGFILESIDSYALGKGLFLPVRELNIMRREAILPLIQTVTDIAALEEPVYAKSRKKMTAALFSSKNDYMSLEDKPDYCFLEVTAVTTVKDFLEGLNPWIPSFIPNDDLSHYTALLSSLDFEFVVCDNSGVGMWCTDKGIKWIAGPQLNSCNRYSFEALRENGAFGAFFSGEISIDQMNSFGNIEGFMTFCRVCGPLLMMTSRQCFFQNASLCRTGKKRKDKKCLNTCSLKTEFYDDHGRKFFLEKSRGYINRIFHGDFLFAPEIIGRVNCECFLADMRFPKMFGINENNIRKISEFFIKSVRIGDSEKSETDKIREMLPTETTAGRYYSGLVPNCK